MKTQQKTPNQKIQKRLNSPDVKPQLGQKVLITNPDGTQYVAEVLSIHSKIKNWILQVKKVDEDGKVEIEEVADLVVEAVIIVKDIVFTDVFKALVLWIKKVFRGKPQAQPSL